MATENLIIRVREDGSLEVSRNIKNIGKSAKGSVTGVELLKRALGALAIGAVIRQTVRIADEFTNLQNRLRLVTSSTEELNRVQTELLNISQRTRSDLGGNVELFNRITLATKDLGTAQEEVLQFTESLNQAVKISGATSTEATAGIIQLSQGLASGALRGDELRSVLEQLPAVADVIATSLGVTRGRLRELGSEGAITAEVVLKAFREAREELDERFQKTVGTTAEEFVKLRNVLTIAVGSFFQATGASEGLARVLNTVTNFIADSIPLITSFGRAFSNTLTPQDELTAGMKLFASAIVIVQSVLTSLVNTLQNTVGTVFTVVGERIGGTAAALVQFAQGNVDEAATIIREVNQDNIDEIVKSAEELRGELIGETTDTIEKLVQIWDEGARLTQEARQRVFEFDVDGGPAIAAPTLALTEAQEKAIETQGKFLQGLAEEQAALQISIDTGKSFAQAQQEIAIQTLAAQDGITGFTDAARAFTAEIERQNDELERRNLASQDAQFLVSLRSEAELIGLSNRERFVETQLRQLSAEATDLQRQEVEKLAGALFDENQKIKQAAFTFEEFTKSLSRGIFDTLSGALANALTDGFDDIPRQFSQLLLQLTSKLLASKLLESLAGLGGGGGFFGNIAGLFAGGFANGGSFTVPGAGGTDSQRVSLDATPGERITVETPAQQRQSEMPVVQVGGPTIINTIDDSDVVGAVNRAGGEVILNKVTENRAAFRQALGLT